MNAKQLILRLSSSGFAAWGSLVAGAFMAVRINQFFAVATGVVGMSGFCTPPASADIHHDSSADPLGDLDRYAAQLAALDLVISVSNTTVHVAGALGVPTWVIVPEGRGGLWYWFTEGERSPWYAAVRLFRRRAGGNILDDIAAALRQSAKQAGS